MDLHHLLTKIPLSDGFDQWCVACRWEINPETQIVLEDYLANALFTLRIDPTGELQQDIAQGVTSIGSVQSRINRLKQLPQESQKTEISELACYSILKWEYLYDDPSAGKYLHCLVTVGAPQDSPGGIDSIAFILSPDSTDDDLLIVGEVKGAVEPKSKQPDVQLPPSRRFQTLSQQTQALVKRFQEEIPQERLPYDLNRIEGQVRLKTGDENLCRRVRRMNTKYVQRSEGVRIVSFLVFKQDWIDDPENYHYLKRYVSNLSALTTQAPTATEENPTEEEQLDDSHQGWSKEQNLVMLFPIPNWAEPNALKQIYDKLSTIPIS